jgi:uncharacterized protein
MRTRFEWDSAKAASNLRKHRVSFELALRVFADLRAWSAIDRIEGGEQRWQTIGMVEGRLLLLIAHTIGEDEEDGQPIEVIRIISARIATGKERNRYERQDG